jgi:hypothetical protein
MGAGFKPREAWNHERLVACDQELLHIRVLHVRGG